MRAGEPCTRNCTDYKTDLLPHLPDRQRPTPNTGNEALDELSASDFQRTTQLLFAGPLTSSRSVLRESGFRGPPTRRETHMPEFNNITATIGELTGNEQKAFSKQLVSVVPKNRIAEFISSIASEMPDTDRKDLALKAVSDLPSETKKDVVSEAASKLSPKDREEVAQMLGPSGKTRDKLWLIVVSAFSIVLVAGFVTLAVGVFQAKPAAPVASAELVLTMFTSAVGFLAGLFVPSPTGRQQT
jgi:hypothetical protein